VASALAACALATASAPALATPSISLVRPADNAHFAQGATVTPVFSCGADAPGAIASCTGPSAIDTSVAGEHTFTVSATDGAGNVATQTAHYVVIAPGQPPGKPSPACYGAASRDPVAPCGNPALRLQVFPKPLDAEIETGAACATVGRKTHTWWLCSGGAPSELAARTVALVGDSHAGHWRPAIDAIGRAQGWRTFFITRASCPFTTARPDLPGRLGSICATWRRNVIRWLVHHPEVTTVLVSAHAGARVVVPKGHSVFAAKVDGYLDAWKALPRTVRHLIVLRDTPNDSTSTHSCVEQAMSRHEPAGPACAIPRSHSLHRDAEVAAALKAHSARFSVIDLSSFMCSRRMCFPVVGGALTHKDANHLTAEFAGSLAPYIMRGMAPLLAGDPPRNDLTLTGRETIPGSKPDARVAYAVTARTPLGWALAPRGDLAALATGQPIPFAPPQVSFAVPGPCGYTIDLTARAYYSPSSRSAVDRLEQLAPAGSTPGPTGSVARLGHALASWGTWRIAEPQAAVVGRWSSSVPNIAAPDGSSPTLEFQVVATATSACTTAADEGMQGEVSALLGSLRPRIVGS
jgi:hypothetical protein